MKTITIAGRITRDAATRSTNNGDKVTGFSVAVDDGYGQNKRTLYFDCSLWGKRGESVAHLLGKGQPVTVAGDLSTREYEGKTGLTVRVSELTLQGKPTGQREERPQQQSQPASRSDYDDGDIPF